MNNIIELNNHPAWRQANSREIELPDQSRANIFMPAERWHELEFLELVEGIKQPELAMFAIEEMSLQDVSFEEAFRGVVAHLAGRWS